VFYFFHQTPANAFATMVGCYDEAENLAEASYYQNVFFPCVDPPNDKVIRFFRD